MKFGPIYSQQKIMLNSAWRSVTSRVADRSVCSGLTRLTRLIYHGLKSLYKHACGQIPFISVGEKLDEPNTLRNGL